MDIVAIVPLLSLALPLLFLRLSSAHDAHTTFNRMYNQYHLGYCFVLFYFVYLLHPCNSYNIVADRWSMQWTVERDNDRRDVCDAE